MGDELSAMSDAYASAPQVLADRIAWAIESLASMVEDATRRGWLMSSAPLETQSDAAASAKPRRA